MKTKSQTKPVVEKKKEEPPQKEEKAKNVQEFKIPEHCPADACPEFLDSFKLGKGAFDPTSEYCLECQKECKATAVLCERMTAHAQVKAKEEKAKKQSGHKVRGDVNAFGHGNNTQAGVLDSMMLSDKGATLAKMISTIKTDGKSDDVVKGRIMTHIAHLRKDHGATIVREGNNYKIDTKKKASAVNQ